MSDIFISYSHSDISKAQMLAKALAQQGWTVWWDPQIQPGNTFDKTIEKALDKAKCVIVLWSNDSVTSDWVKTEAAEGKDRKILVPVLIDDIKIPLEFRRIQAARLIDWDGTLNHPEFKLLLSAISLLVNRTSLSKPSSKNVWNRLDVLNELDELQYKELIETFDELQNLQTKKGN